jgi:dihydroorotate dehydrogenase electron transfer subunit
MHFPNVVKIKRIIEETPTVKTFIFPWKIKEEIPGQFIMLWNFQDEKPMSISVLDPVNDEMGLSIKRVGPFTNAVHRLKEGDQLGLRGPYGRGFQISGSKILAVGGGVGMAPIAPLVEEAIRRGLEVDLITAAATRDEILFQDRLETSGANVLPTTDDGSHGFCGFATELAEELLSKAVYDMMVCCGPEIMMKKLFDLSERFQLPAQFSLERWMKCALGLCGQCCMDDVGWRVCVEGPVFCGHELRLISEFGLYHRDAAGTKHHF